MVPERIGPSFCMEKSRQGLAAVLKAYSSPEILRLFAERARRTAYHLKFRSLAASRPNVQNAVDAVDCLEVWTLGDIETNTH